MTFLRLASGPLAPGLVAFLLLASSASAQNFPSKPVRIVVPFGAGGVADLTARTVAQKLGESLGQAVVIENKPGAGGVVAGDAVAKAEPDGHTLLLMSNGTAVSAGLFKSLPFDTVRDFAPVSTLGFFDIAIITPADSKFKNLGELLAFAKANPGKLNLGSINVGSTQNLAAELFKTSARVDMQIVPFNGTPAVITALRGGQIDAALEILGPVLPQIKANTLRALAVTGEKRAAVLPDVPTAKESGLPAFVASSWNALAAPAKTPKDVIARLNKDITAVLNSPDVKKKLADLNVEARASSPEQAAELLAGETKRWGEVIVRARIPAQ
ncbi:MAG: tripartite tricarboxylate transporter substrate binding protein [Polaromonas sp.]|uniref:Bug family tripartite tricarboxylate transporter substrate binding protein n=1 Tax=Polaromonas sp. TaxID=1869339 RepID=UPI0018082752|nr:tripartite tricarboxylate transporter substrate binding protein [Polaromonas sp.]MBA3592979.1 tripartite tricarboxylate transporter substrate binding protein [Polaromonas sp.]